MFVHRDYGFERFCKTTAPVKKVQNRCACGESSKPFRLSTKIGTGHCESMHATWVLSLNHAFSSCVCSKTGVRRFGNHRKLEDPAVCMYVCMHVCMYACMYVCMYVWHEMYEMYLCMYVCNICMYVCMYPCMYVLMYVCMYVFIYLCMFVCMYVMYVGIYHICM